MLRKIVRRARRVSQVIALGVRLSQLGAGPLARVRVFSTTVSLGARRILRRPSGRLRTLRLRSPGGPRTVVVGDYGELEVMRDIVLDEEYALTGLEPRTIVDLGANVGMASAWFRGRYPEARIVAVEPDPDTFAKLERNLAGDDAVTLVNAAVAGEAGEVELFQPSGYSISSSLSASRDDQGASSARVRACTLDELWTELGLERVDLLKLDVEGAELEVLEGFTRIDSVGAIVGEAHPKLLEGRVDAFFDRLAAFDVERISETPDGISFIARRR
jgi:FkbM family methyltransferase